VRAQEPSREGQVQVSAFGLKILSQTPIANPNGIRGRVVIEVSLDAAGNVANAIVKDAPGFPAAPSETQQEVLDTVRKWRFANDSSGSRALVVVVFAPPPTPYEKYVKEVDDLFRAGKVEESLRSYKEGETKFPEHRIDFMKRQAEVFIRQHNESAT